MQLLKSKNHRKDINLLQEEERRKNRKIGKIEERKIIEKVIETGKQKNWVEIMKENKIGFKKINRVYLKEEKDNLKDLVNSLTPVSSQNINNFISMPVRGLIFFNLNLLEKYVVNSKSQNFSPSFWEFPFLKAGFSDLSSLSTGYLKLKGISISKSGNEGRSKKQKFNIGQFYSLNKFLTNNSLFYSNLNIIRKKSFVVNNRRAIIGIKMKLSWGINYKPLQL